VWIGNDDLSATPIYVQLVLSMGDVAELPDDGPQSCQSSCSDTNCDGSIDFNDIDCFVAALIDVTAWQSCGTACAGDNYLCANDVNADGAVDFTDVDSFVEALIQGACQ